MAKLDSNSHAFTLVEIVVATVILAIAMLGVMSAFISGTKLVSASKYRLQAINYAQQVLENLRQEVRADTWDTVGNKLRVGNYGPFNVLAPHPLANFGGVYAYNVSEVNPGEPRRVDLTVTWTMP